MVEEFKRGGRLRKKDPVDDAGEDLTLKSLEPRVLLSFLEMYLLHFTH